MHKEQTRFLPLAGRTIVAHTLTYILMGALASHFLNYAAIFSNPCSGMRPFSSPWVTAGPILQPIRGLAFAAAFYPFRDRLFGPKFGWLLMAWMLIGLGILSPFAAASGSIEGMIYTTIPLRVQLSGWIEIVPQALLLSGLLCFWTNHPGKKWLSWTLMILFTLVMVLFGYSLVTGKH